MKAFSSMSTAKGTRAEQRWAIVARNRQFELRIEFEEILVQMTGLDRFTAGYELDHSLGKPRVFLGLRRPQHAFAREDRQIGRRLTRRARFALLQKRLDRNCFAVIAGDMAPGVDQDRFAVATLAVQEHEFLLANVAGQRQTAPLM